MKKNVLMRAASGLLVATMLTTCAISGTFAKYVTQDNGGDVARVAKWGVTAQVVGDLYGKNYLDGTGNTKTDAASGISVSGIQHAQTNVVAPGTKNTDGFSFNVNGTPEVDSQLTMELTWQNIYLAAGSYGVMVPADAYITEENIEEIAAANELYTSADGKTFTKYKATGNVTDLTGLTFYTLEDVVTSTYDYYPVVYNLNGSTDGVLDTTYGYVNKYTTSTNTLEEIANKILTAVQTPTSTDGDAGSSVVTTKTVTGKCVSNIKVESAVIDHNRNLTDVFGFENTNLTWDWEFENQDVNANTVEQNHDISVEDKLDTILGNLMAQRVEDEGVEAVPANTTSSKIFDGIVVKTTDNAETYVLPQEAGTSDDGAQDDFCLDTKFEICILVEQVD